MKKETEESQNGMKIKTYTFLKTKGFDFLKQGFDFLNTRF